MDARYQQPPSLTTPENRYNIDSDGFFWNDSRGCALEQSMYRRTRRYNRWRSIYTWDTPLDVSDIIMVVH